MRFPVVVHKDEGSSYGVTIPDLPWLLLRRGHDWTRPFSNAQEAVTVPHVEAMFMAGELLPKTRPLQEHHANEDYRDAQYWGFVDVDLSTIENKAVRLNITMPSRVLALVDEAAARVQRITLRLPGARRTGAYRGGTRLRMALAPAVPRGGVVREIGGWETRWHPRVFDRRVRYSVQYTYHQGTKERDV